MSKLPTQLKWSQFVGALKNLELKELPSKGGSARSFERLRDGEILTFHQPHGNDTIRQGTLTEYLRKMGVSREAFEAALWRTERAREEQLEDDRFKHSLEEDGTIISNCMACFEVVIKSKVEDEVSAAEAVHPCYLSI